MKINFKEASTKRAIVMTITGMVTLYQIVFGSGSPNIDALLARVEWWMGIGLTIVGMFGFLPDQLPRTGQERTRETDLPKIELQGRSESSERRDFDSTNQPLDSGADLPVFDAEPVQRMRNPGLPPDAVSQNPEQSVRSDQGGYNG